MDVIEVKPYTGNLENIENKYILPKKKIFNGFINLLQQELIIKSTEITHDYNLSAKEVEDCIPKIININPINIKKSIRK
jgi:hypothetical protein